MIGEDIKYEVQHLLTEITEQTNETTDWIKSHGLNKVTYKNLDTFEGQYNEAKLRDGLGTYIWNMREKATTDDESAPLKQLAKFEGQYSGGVRNGFGKMTFPNQDVYQGTFKDGKMEGSGTYSYAASKDIYSGEFSGGVRHGQGVYEFCKDKSVLKGQWAHDEFKVGDWVMTDQVVYSGMFCHGNPIGKGQFATIGQATIVSGIYTERSTDDVEQIASVRWITHSTLKM